MDITTFFEELVKFGYKPSLLYDDVWVFCIEGQGYRFEGRALDIKTAIDVVNGRVTEMATQYKKIINA